MRLGILRSQSLWQGIHRYLGLSLGLLLSIVCLSGSLSLYREPIDRWLNPELHLEAQGQRLNLDSIFARLHQAHPERNDAWVLELPQDQHEPIIAWFERPKESLDLFYAPLMVAINPYTGDIINSRFWGKTLCTWVLDLHNQLLLGQEGRNSMPIIAICLVYMALSGLYLSWPGWRQVQRLFLLRHQHSWRLLIVDLHRWLGLFSSGILLLIAISGFNLAYPELLEKLTASQGMGHGDAGPNVRSSAQPNNHPISIEEAILVARGLFPSAEVKRITTPRGELGTYKINLRQRDELNQHHPFTSIWIDRWSGHIRAVNNPHQFTLGQQFASWQWPIHTSEAFGESARWLWFLAGLSPTLFWLSGIWLWLCRKGRIADRRVTKPQFAFAKKPFPAGTSGVAQATSKQFKRQKLIVQYHAHIAWRTVLHEIFPASKVRISALINQLKQYLRNQH